MYPHTIQLRPPWQQATDEQSQVLARFFNTPTGLESTETVWIVVDAPNATAEVHCNDQPLGTVAQSLSGEFEITELLQNRNQLRLYFATSEQQPEFAGVRLEIRLKSN